MRVLWLVNIVIPELCDEFGFNSKVFGGWLTGMWNQLKQIQNISLGICVPIIDVNRKKDGIIQNYKYYSFDFVTDYNHILSQKERFKEIINEFHPDVIHIWGTEYSHSIAMVNACEELNLADKILVNIQGLVSYCSKYYAYGLTSEQKNMSYNGRCISDEIYEFQQKGKYEEILLKSINNISGRTDWDRTCVKKINPDLNYYYCKEILRNVFYENHGAWSFEKCEKNAIFISQAGYALKGLHNALDSFAKVKKEVPVFKVYIGGNNMYEADSAYASIIRDMIRKYKLEDNIEFVGFLDEQKMLEYYLKANIFLSVSNIENSSNSICEALHVGTPIISTCVGGVSSLLLHDKNSLLYSLEERYLLSSYILELFGNKNMCCKLSNNGKRQVESESPKKIALDLYNIYKKII